MIVSICMTFSGASSRLPPELAVAILWVGLHGSVYYQCSVISTLDRGRGVLQKLKGTTRTRTWVSGNSSAIRIRCDNRYTIAPSSVLQVIVVLLGRLGQSQALVRQERAEPQEPPTESRWTLSTRRTSFQAARDCYLNLPNSHSTITLPALRQVQVHAYTQVQGEKTFRSPSLSLILRPRPVITTQKQNRERDRRSLRLSVLVHRSISPRII